MRFGSLQQSGGRVKASPTRRTTIVVGDMDASIKFYRDTLGLTVFYDQQIASAEEGQLLGFPGARIRIVSLKSESSEEGMVGLMQFLKDDVNPRAKIRQLLAHPDLFLIFLTDDIQAVHARLLQNGADIKCPPIEYEIPGRGISAGLTCYDPNGVLVEFTQFGPINA
jgi:catechol 2,3-dioxygenase-like lactoylglutathione lyase family enzyme